MNIYKKKHVDWYHHSLYSPETLELIDVKPTFSWERFMLSSTLHTP